MTERATIYRRISEDPRQTELGVARQGKECEALVVARGWALVDTYTDNDVAVLKPGAHRPGYAALMAAVERGEVDRVVAYGLSRLWRNRRERADAIELLKARRVSVTLVRGSDLDMTSAAGRMYAGVLGEVDTAESEVKGERVASAALQRAERGRANGHVAYGWRRMRTRDANGEVIDWRDDLDPDQAAVVVEIVDRLLTGDTLKAVTADLNERGTPPPRAALAAVAGRGTGKHTPARWLPSMVRKLAIRPANAGLVVWDGAVLTGVTAQAPAIVERDRHERVCALLADPARRTAKSGARTHLLTYGVGVCGVCRGVLRHRGVAHGLYVCERAGCVGRHEQRVDALVRAVVVERLSRPDVADLLAGDDTAAQQARARAAGLRSRLDAAADDYADGLIDREQIRRITSKLRPELERAETDAQRAVPGIAPEFLTEIAGPQAADRWDGMSIAQRRALLEALDLTVVIKPGRGGPRFKPELIEFEWTRL